MKTSSNENPNLFLQRYEFSYDLDLSDALRREDLGPASLIPAIIIRLQYEHCEHSGGWDDNLFLRCSRRAPNVQQAPNASPNPKQGSSRHQPSASVVEGHPVSPTQCVQVCSQCRLEAGWHGSHTCLQLSGVHGCRRRSCSALLCRPVCELGHLQLFEVLKRACPPGSPSACFHGPIFFDLQNHACPDLTSRATCEACAVETLFMAACGLCEPQTFGWPISRQHCPVPSSWDLATFELAFCALHCEESS